VNEGVGEMVYLECEIAVTLWMSWWVPNLPYVNKIVHN